jgi:NAD(P)-dependent dehydrogenase (short-subunit alcohol dehydrogenase family)
MKKNVVVTGGAGGLGLCIAKKHASLGDSVFLIDVKETPELEVFLKANPKAEFQKCDISKTVHIKAAFKPFLEKINHLDYLYSCAGIFRLDEKVPLPDLDLDKAGIMYEINAVGAMRVVQALWNVIGDGTVLMMITSEAGSVSMNWRSQEYNYCMSKAAENMGCVILQHHFHEMKQNTRVLCLHPGWMRTAMGGEEALKNLASSVAPEDSAEALVGIALDIESIPPENMYMDYKRKLMTW